MEVTYNLEPGDFVQFHKFWLLKKSPNKPWQVLLGILVLLLVDNLPLSRGWRPASHTLTILVLSFVTGQVVNFRPSTEKRARELPGFVGLHTMAISAECILHQTTVTDSKIKWNGVVDITEDRLLLYLFLSPSDVLMIPKRAFATSSDAEEFMNMAKAYWKNLDYTSRTSSGTTWPPPPKTLKL